ncbi:hypothetical protein BDV27DRAFT_121874 [Aspergillus caelatus]|uniref:Uncharacterized protein n=1 Tax=Aspergillus caelatus TaxID=61420 RepID=A0A5N7AG93_9EURO|nr:uncharacterized protein BDV27DRAFT_121874 [Aspergillus caelatus]KAE8368725.1 hypothetical protein BDV27DRAFT_121874 [Aspergillus caelatus]
MSHVPTLYLTCTEISEMFEAVMFCQTANPVFLPTCLWLIYSSIQPYKSRFVP